MCRRSRRPGVQFIWTGHFDASPLITDILYDHAMEVAKNPKNSAAAHRRPRAGGLRGQRTRPEDPPASRGPNQGEEHFADVRIINIQDDAIVPVRESNVRKMRVLDPAGPRPAGTSWWCRSRPRATAYRPISRRTCKGLNYSFAEKGLAEHPKFIQWAEGLFEQAVAQSGAGTAPSAKPAPKPAASSGS